MKVIVTGTTGMVGEGVLLECLEHPDVTAVLSVSRKPSGLSHAKLKEYIVPDFRILTEGDEVVKGYDACFYCAGVSSVGMEEGEYTRITYDTTLAFAKAVGPGADMSFFYVSGAGTDSSEKGRLMWARLKGKTENDLMKLPFKRVLAFRPGLMKVTPGQQHVSSLLKFASHLYPLINAVAPNIASTLSQVGQAMIYAAQNGYERNVVEVSDIKILAKRAAQALAG